jgi:hypothetical protein
MPVPDRDDAVSGCVQHLLGLPDVAVTLGADPGGFPLVVQDAAPEREVFPGTVALVAAHGGNMGGNDHNTQERVRLLLEFWSDPPREGGYVIEPSAGRRAMVAAYTAVDRAMHRPLGGQQRWGALMTTDCVRLAGLTPYQVPNADGLWRGTAFYAVGLA